jgi:hypothetical protein
LGAEIVLLTPRNDRVGRFPCAMVKAKKRYCDS